MVKHLTKKEMLLINKKLLDFFGKKEGEVNDMYMEVILAATNSFPGEDREALLSKAAIMLERIVVMRPFTEGNDRTAYEAARVFLETNGIKLDAEEKEIVKMLQETAKFERGIGAVKDWLDLHSPVPEKETRKERISKSPAKKEVKKPEAPKPKKYTVFVDDNYHYMDKSQRYKLGDFDSCEKAVNACKRIVDEYFEKVEPGKATFKELWSNYTTFGEDPYVVCVDEECKFSAWDYAKKKCKELAKKE